MIDGALNSKSTMSFNGSDFEVKTRDVDQEAKDTADMNK